ncbi:MAG: trimethylamine methyltransferase [Chloroflexi bacterium]|nr:trimethylamine methyltransferase [Chloroflexota bacterium]
MRSGTSSLITPRLQILSEDQKETLFLSALEVLQSTGVRVDHDEGLELLAGAGARVGKDRRVYIGSNLVEDALVKAPRQITFYDRLGDRAFSLGGTEVHYASQIDSLFFFDPFTGHRRPLLRTDTRLGAIVCDALPNIDMISPSAPYDNVPSQLGYTIGHKEILLNSTKPIMHGMLDLASLKDVAEMAALVRGGWDELARRPYYLHYAEPFSPLTHSVDGTGKLLYCVEKGIPVIYTPMTMSGSSAPVTGAGNLVSLMAESLGGFVMAQLKRPGAPVVFGGVPTIMDMTNMISSYGAPEMHLWSAVMCEMAQYLHLPVMSTAGCTDSVTFDQQAAAESAISCLMAALSGANLVHDVGFMEAAASASLELIVATDEFIGMIRAIMGGIEISPETLALNVIDQVGPSNDYMAEDHTARHFREHWQPSLMTRHSYEQWVAEGKLTMGDKANARVRQLIREHEPTPMDPALVAELDKMEELWWVKS